MVGVDNLNDAYDPRLKQWRLAQLQPRKNFRFHQLDITDRAALEPLFAADGAEPPFAAVVNLAARAGVRPSVTNPWVYYQANCIGTLNLLDMCRQSGVRKFLLASTSSLYGKHNQVPYREDADTNRPLSPYAASKKAAETLAFTYHHLHGLDVSIPRYFTVYGPAGRPDMSVFRFIRRIAEGEPIIVFGDGSQSRDFTFVDDIAARHDRRAAAAGLRSDQPRRRPGGGAERDHRADCRVAREEAADRVSPGPSGRRAHHLGRRVEGRPAAGLEAAGRHRRGAAPLRGVVSREPRHGPIAGTGRSEGIGVRPRISPNLADDGETVKHSCIALFALGRCGSPEGDARARLAAGENVVS